jgi:hypothetical protein
MPEPFSNHEMCVWRGQREYLKWRDDGAPEDILENLRQYVVTASWYIAQKNSGREHEHRPAGCQVPGDVAGACRLRRSRRPSGSELRRLLSQRRRCRLAPRSRSRLC